MGPGSTSPASAACHTISIERMDQVQKSYLTLALFHSLHVCLKPLAVLLHPICDDATQHGPVARTLRNSASC